MTIAGFIKDLLAPEDSMKDAPVELSFRARAAFTPLEAGIHAETGFFPFSVENPSGHFKTLELHAAIDENESRNHFILYLNGVPMETPVLLINFTRDEFEEFVDEAARSGHPRALQIKVKVKKPEESPDRLMYRVDSFSYSRLSGERVPSSAMLQ